MIDPQIIFSFPKIESTATGGFRTKWTVPDQLPYFDGHFPGNPILPAVAILDASQEFLRLAGLPVNPLKLTLKKAKFLALVEPGMNLEISAEPLNAQWLVRWNNPEAARAQSLCEVSFSL
jgi:3-hydroxymyristoyl/3-hydroxydecanoyl-(acyl carrier protein) dehydratase